MIKYISCSERTTARFDTQGSTDKQYWADNITTNICRLLKSEVFRPVIYAIAWKYVNRRSSFVGVMNYPPNTHVGEVIARHRLMAKYDILERKVYNKFLEYLKQLNCVRSLETRVRHLTQILTKIEDNIASYQLVRHLTANQKGELL